MNISKSGRILKQDPKRRQRKNNKDNFLKTFQEPYDIATCKCKDLASCKCEKSRKVPVIEKAFLLDQRIYIKLT